MTLPCARQDPNARDAASAGDFTTVLEEVLRLRTGPGEKMTVMDVNEVRSTPDAAPAAAAASPPRSCLTSWPTRTRTLASRRR